MTSFKSSAMGAVTRLMWCLCCAAILAGCTGGPGTLSANEPERRLVVEDGLVVALVPHRAAGSDISAAAERLGYVLREETTLGGLGLFMLSFELPDGVTGAQAIKALEDAVPVSTVGVNHAYRLQNTGTAASRLNYANAALNWPSGGCRSVGPVGVIDTGVDASAPGLARTRVIAERFAPGAPASPRHGTDVASILADPTRMSGVTLYNADVMGQESSGEPLAGAETLIRALDWMAGEGVKIVNLSLAGPYNKLLDLAVDAAHRRGMILVAAVGNLGPRTEPQYPAGFSSVIAVTAVDAAGRVYPRAIRGAHVDFAAPGVDVFVASDGGGRFVTGTSMAAPFVTARIAADAGMASGDVAEIRARLATTAKDLGPTGVDRKFGAGLVQAAGSCRASAS